RASSGRPSPASTTAAWSRCSSSTRRSPRSSSRPARWSSSSASPARSGPCASSASPSSSTARPARTTACPARPSASTPRRPSPPRATPRRRSPTCSRAAPPPAPRRPGTARRCGRDPAAMSAARATPGHEAAPEGAERTLLKMSELAERSGVSPGTIRYYLREGLLGEGEDIVRTSRNMAYYPPSYVERISLIKRLQEERFMPLRVIRGALRDDPDRVRALIELEDRILERALASVEDRSRVSRKAAVERYGVPQGVLDRLAEIGVLTPNQRGYDQDDIKIIEAIAAFRAGGYE